ncbi:hypothetical protein SAMN05660328_101516 [Streptococcus gallolyticus]|uniref:Uncharacterized protein n=1 Tax=Streptococcus gallolyticus TaxID=315405 RepID=A0A1I7FQ23_9STRE|nr:hypothetical protein [Streptococcus gallolyticus]SFC11358.1 hypothetical protein SAMN02983012_0665 [Streptococcus gallolyticus]SFU38126.1 hypothetical protein SAMN05660328_101516 [Streptococcus gallolyticus]
MKLKFDVKKIIVFLTFIVFFLVDTRFFYLVDLPSAFSGEAQNKTLLAVTAIVIFVIYLFFVKNGKISLGNFGLFIASIMFIILLSAIWSLIYFRYPLRQVLWPLVQFFPLLLYFPFKSVLSKKMYYDLFLKLAEIFYSILAVLFLIQVITYNGISSLFLKIDDMILTKYIYDYSSLRIYSVFEGTTRILMLMVAYAIIKKGIRNSIFDIISFLLMLAAVVVVDQSRYYLITTIISVVVLYILESGYKITGVQLVSSLILVAVGLHFLLRSTTSIFYSFIDNTGSSYARIGAIVYYLKLITFRHPLLGLGLSLPIEGTDIYYYIKGPQGIYNFSDIGIFGVFAELGILGLLWYVILCCKLVFISIKKTQKNPLVIAIVINFLLSLPIMSFIDRPRIVALMLMFVVIETQVGKNEKTINC